ncbi:MAG: MBL fold metallo-hydrolase [Victivallaceae bacterium]
MKRSRITVVVDNASAPPLAKEFGLSLLVEISGDTVLFDTGAGNALPVNFEHLCPEPGRIGKVVLSHGHYDHTGGLSWAMPRLPKAELYLAPGIFKRRFSRHGEGDIHEISMPDACVRAVDSHLLKHEVSEFTEIADGMFLTGPIPRISGEDCGGDFFFDPECRSRDAVCDEQALLLGGGVLIQGCCHAGIINTIEYCRRMKPDIRIRTVIGGLHLLHADGDRMAETVKYLNDSGIEKLVALHCSGDEAVEFLKRELSGSGCEVATGAAGDTFNE